MLHIIKLSLLVGDIYGELPLDTVVNRSGVHVIRKANDSPASHSRHSERLNNTRVCIVANVIFKCDPENIFFRET